MRIYILLFICLFVCNYLFAQQTLIPSGSTWKYNDWGVNLGSSWKDPGFNTSGWSAGPSELGYGDGDEATIVSYGPSTNNKHITTYFLKNFNVVNASQYSSLQLDLVCDDGAVIYLNGLEIARYNMPSGYISYNTFAISTVNWPNENNWNILNTSAAALLEGANTIAIEIHQSDVNSSDISFNLKLNGITNTQNIALLRGPYLQTGTPNSMIIKWRTDILTDSKILYGTDIHNLSAIAMDFLNTKDHEIKIEGLSAQTKYFYKIIGNNTVIKDTSQNQYFITSPDDNYKGPIKFWVIGDAGMGNQNQRAVRNAYLNFNNGSHADGWIMLGDNAYESGTDNEYQLGVFKNMYESILENTVLWPAAGNHDYNNHIPFSTIYYYEIFSLPKNAEAGGTASGTEKYYSYNYGNIHFVVLDSYDEGRGPQDAMANWLRQDLTTNTKPWIIAYWHHPPYTKGSHNSDNTNFLDGELVDMRENILPILEQFGADLILNGHSHCYERSMLINGHYGNSSSFNSSHKISDGMANYPSNCPYIKNDSVYKANKGTVYSVVGCSGKLSGTSNGWPHPIMKKSSNTLLGSMILEIENNKLRGRFIDTNLTVFDDFTIFKNVNKKIDLTICSGDSVELISSWNGYKLWSLDNSLNDTLKFTPDSSTQIIVNDSYNCLSDTFNIEVIPLTNAPCNPLSKMPNLVEKESIKFNIYPNPLKNSQHLNLNFSSSRPGKGYLQVYSINGELLGNETLIIEKGNNTFTFSNLKLGFGEYLLKVIVNEINIFNSKIFIK
jgi:hypothetical protein